MLKRSKRTQPHRENEYPEGDLNPDDGPAFPKQFPPGEDPNDSSDDDDDMPGGSDSPTDSSSDDDSTTSSGSDTSSGSNSSTGSRGHSGHKKKKRMTKKMVKALLAKMMGKGDKKRSEKKRGRKYGHVAKENRRRSKSRRRESAAHGDYQPPTHQPVTPAAVLYSAEDLKKVKSPYLSNDSRRDKKV